MRPGYKGNTSLSRYYYVKNLALHMQSVDISVCFFFNLRFTLGFLVIKKRETKGESSNYIQLNFDLLEVQ